MIYDDMTNEEQYTDEWGVTYSSNGRVLKEVNPQLFTCEEYTIPKGVEVMEGDFFFKNTKLRKITLPRTLRKMEANAFIRCPLEDLELQEGLIEIPEFMVEGCKELRRVTLPSTIRKIMIGAFNCCRSLQEVNLPEGIEFIDESTFRICKSLKQVNLPSKLEIIRAELFYGSGIESIEIHQNIKEICYWAFWGWKQL